MCIYLYSFIRLCYIALIFVQVSVCILY